MFCMNCGAEIQSPAKFCPKCGTSVNGASAPSPAPAPVPNQAYTYQGQSGGPAKGKKPYNVYGIVGLGGAALALISTFLPLFTMFGVGVNLYQLMRISDTGGEAFMLFLTYIGSGLVVLFHLIRHPKISIVGAVLLIINMIFFLLIKSTDYTISLGIGFWVFVLGIIAVIVGIVGAFVKTNK